MRLALLALPSIRDEVLGLGDVAVERRGPDTEGAYSWLVAVLQETGLPDGPGQTIGHSSLAVASFGLTGIDAAASVTVLHYFPADFGVRLTTGYTPVSGNSAVAVPRPNQLSQPLSQLQPQLSFSSSITSMSQWLSVVEYQPPSQWTGNVTLVVRLEPITDGDDGVTTDNSNDDDNNIASEVQAVVVQIVVERQQSIAIPLSLLWMGHQLMNNSRLSLVVKQREAVRLSLLPSYPPPSLVVKADGLGLQVAGGGILNCQISARYGRLSTDISETDFIARSTTVALEGSADHLNAALLTLVYESSNTTATLYDWLDVELKGSNTSLSSSIRLRLFPVNHPPVLDWQGVERFGLLTDDTEPSVAVAILSVGETAELPLGEYFRLSDPDIELVNSGGEVDLEVETEMAELFLAVSVDRGLLYLSLPVDTASAGLKMFSTAEAALGREMSVEEQKLLLGKGEGNYTDLMFANISEGLQQPAAAVAEGLFNLDGRTLSRSLYLKGSLSALQQAVKTLRYRPAEPRWRRGYFAFASVYLNDLGGFEGPDQGLAASVRFVIGVTDEPVGPQLIMPPEDQLWTLEVMMRMVKRLQYILISF